MMRDNDKMQRIAVDYLTISRNRVDEAVRVRAQYARLAHGYGVSYRRIGEALGMSAVDAQTITESGDV